MLSGLTHREVAAKLKEYGYNELPSAKPKRFWQFILDIVKEPMIALLLAASILYFFLGDRAEAILLLISIAGVISISVYQERKSEKSLQALTRLSSPRAVVIREGKELRIPGREVTLSDVVVLTEGDRVPADMEIIEAVNLNIDESLLTGESKPVLKNNDGSDTAYSGTMVVGGRGVGRVTAIGLSTELGKIGKSLKSIEIEKTLLQREIKSFVFWLAGIGLFLCIVLATIYIILNGQVIEGILAGLTLAIGILPEEFPLVLLLFMTMGAWRLAKKNVLARRAATIETLGAATVLCVDKTGTITKNKMTIEKTIPFGKNDQAEVIRYGILASQRKPFDPMETAFIAAGEELFDVSALYDQYLPIKEYPLDSDFLNVAHAYKLPGNAYEVALKGSAESVVDLCHLTPLRARKIKGEVKSLAEAGYRVIAVARGKYQGKNLPENRHEIKFEFLGLVGLADPVRAGVAESVKLANTAGIRIIMITGDYKETALQIAGEIGLKTKGVITGEEFERASEKKRKDILASVSVFSRVRPNQKLLIIKELQKRGEVVAMTGDGVNDAPALKAANIGIAMGKRGTDVAREAAAIVLLDDNFNSIVTGVKLGRRIYDNLQKAINYLISVHIPIVALSIVPVFLKLPLALMPIHIVFLELIIDPTCTIVFEEDTEDDDIMERPPRDLADRIVALRNLFWPIVNGLVVGGLLSFVYFYTLRIYPAEMARTLTFSLLVMLNLVLILTNLSRRENLYKKLKNNENRALIAVLLFTLAVLLLAINVPFLISIFNFAKINASQAVQLFMVAVLFLLLLEIPKLRNHRRF